MANNVFDAFNNLDLEEGQKLIKVAINLANKMLIEGSKVNNKTSRQIAFVAILTSALTTLTTLMEDKHSKEEWAEMSEHISKAIAAFPFKSCHSSLVKADVRNSLDSRAQDSAFIKHFETLISEDK